ncbi:hypothetical protein ACWERV_17135 [Streptomyces sp. NPDC004031]
MTRPRLRRILDALTHTGPGYDPQPHDLPWVRAYAEEIALHAADARRCRAAWRSARKRAAEHLAEQQRVRGWLSHWAERARTAEATLASVRRAVADAKACGGEDAGCTVDHRDIITDLIDGTTPTEPARCCVCGCPDVTYRNYRDQPLCCRCAMCCDPPNLCGHGCQPRAAVSFAAAAETATEEEMSGPDPAELTADEARQVADDLGRELYAAQDALAFVREMCDIADRDHRPVTTADVRAWLDGPKCARQTGLVIHDEPTTDTLLAKLRAEPHLGLRTVLIPGAGWIWQCHTCGTQAGEHYTDEDIAREYADKHQCTAAGERPITTHTYQGNGGPCAADFYGQTCEAPRADHDLTPAPEQTIADLVVAEHGHHMRLKVDITQPEDTR